MPHKVINPTTRNHNSLASIRIHKRPSIPISSDNYDTLIKNKVKSVNAETSPVKRNYLRTVSFIIPTASSIGNTFKQKRISESNVHKRIMSKGKDTQNSHGIKSSKIPIAKYEWEVKGKYIPVESQKPVLPKPLWKTLWVVESSLTFYIFPKVSRKEKYEI